VIGRKAHLTSTGEVLYRRAKALLTKPARSKVLPEPRCGLGSGAAAVGGDNFPTWLLLHCFARFAEERPRNSHRVV